MKTRIITREIFGRVLGDGYATDCSMAKADIRNELLNIPTNNKFGRVFYNITANEPCIRYTAMVLPCDENHKFLTTNGRSGAYFGISMLLNNKKLNPYADYIMNNILDRLCGKIYVELPDNNLKLLIDDFYGAGLRELDYAIEDCAAQFNQSELRSKCRQGCVFDSIKNMTIHEKLHGLNIFKLRDKSTRQSVESLLNTNGVFRYQFIFDDTFVITDEIYEQYEKTKRKNITDLYFLTKEK